MSSSSLYLHSSKVKPRKRAKLKHLDELFTRGNRAERILVIYRALMRSRWGLTVREIMREINVTNRKTARRYILYVERSGVPIIIDHMSFSDPWRYRISLDFKQRELDGIRAEGLRRG